jgi:hypothetical protein
MSQGPGVGSTTNPLDNSPVALSRAAANATREAVAYVRRQTRGGQALPRRQNEGDGRWTAKFKTPGGGISAAASTAAPTHAVCSYCDWIASASSWSASSDTDTVYNPSTGGAVTANQYITALYVAGIWEAVTDPC